MASGDTRARIAADIAAGRASKANERIDALERDMAALREQVEAMAKQLARHIGGQR